MGCPRSVQTRARYPWPNARGQRPLDESQTSQNILSDRHNLLQSGSVTGRESGFAVSGVGGRAGQKPGSMGKRRLRRRLMIAAVVVWEIRTAARMTTTDGSRQRGAPRPIPWLASR